MPDDNSQFPDETASWADDQNLNSLGSAGDTATSNSKRYKTALQGLGGAAAGLYNNMGPGGRARGPNINPAAVGQSIGNLFGGNSVQNAPVPPPGVAPQFPNTTPMPSAPAVPGAQAAPAATPMAPQPPQAPGLPTQPMAVGGTVVGEMKQPSPAPQAIFDSSWTRTPPNPPLPTMAGGGAVARGPSINTAPYTPVGNTAPAGPSLGGGQGMGMASLGPQTMGSFTQNGTGQGYSQATDPSQAQQLQMLAQGGGYSNPNAVMGGYSQLGTSQTSSPYGSSPVSNMSSPYTPQSGQTMATGLPAGWQQTMPTGTTNAGGAQASMQPGGGGGQPYGGQLNPQMGGMRQQPMQRPQQSPQQFPMQQGWPWQRAQPNAAGAGGPSLMGIQTGAGSMDSPGGSAGSAGSGLGQMPQQAQPAVTPPAPTTDSSGGVTANAGYGSQAAVDATNASRQWAASQMNPTMAGGGVIDGGLPGYEPPKAEAAQRRYSPIGPRNPAATMTPSPEDMAHRLPNRLSLAPKINVKLPRPKIK